MERDSFVSLLNCALFFLLSKNEWGRVEETAGRILRLWCGGDLYRMVREGGMESERH